MTEIARQYAGKCVGGPADGQQVTGVAAFRVQARLQTHGVTA